MITHYASNIILKNLCGKTQYATIASRAFIALSSTLPVASGGGVTEPTGNGYARKQIGYYQDTYGQLMGNPVDGEITNTSEIHFDEATGAWGSVLYACIYDAATSGNLLAWGELGTYVDGTWTPGSISPLANTVVVIKTGDLKISIT